MQGRDTQLVLALNLMIARRGERSLVLRRSHLRVVHHINYGGHPCHLQSRALMSQIAWLPYLPCAEFHSPAICATGAVCIMWDKLYARKSFRSSARGESRSLANFLSHEIVRPDRTRTRDRRNRRGNRRGRSAPGDTPFARTSDADQTAPCTIVSFYRPFRKSFVYCRSRVSPTYRADSHYRTNAMRVDNAAGDNTEGHTV